MSTKSEVEGLRIDRSTSSSSNSFNRTKLLSVGIPLLIVTMFVGVLLWAGRIVWQPRVEVTVVPVTVLHSFQARQSADVLFKAPGWIEPMPTAIQVPSLTEGIIKHLLVVEGQIVKEGDVLATLLDADSQLALRRVQAEHDIRSAECKSTEADLQAAQVRFDHPVHLQAMLADAQSVLTQRKIELTKLPFLLQSAASQKRFAVESLEGKESASAVISRRVVGQARLDSENSEIVVNEIEKRMPLLASEVEALESKVGAISMQLSLLVDETKELKNAQAKREASLAKLNECDVMVEQAMLKLARTQIKSPINGRVLRLVAQPGTRVMGLEMTAGQNTSTIVTMYDPNKLQVRVDVRLEDLPMIYTDQRVSIETASIREPLEGRVLLVTSTANIQKNTVEVKVLITQPPDLIRPDMIVTASFFSQSTGHEVANRESAVVCAMPRSLIDFEGSSGTVWVVGPRGTALKKRIRIFIDSKSVQVTVLEGLVPTDKLISSSRSRLIEGQQVIVNNDNRSEGI